MHTSILCVASTDGVYLGDPRNPHSRVFVKGITQDAIVMAENSGATPERLAVNLLTVLFTETELANGNCTKPRKDGIMQLDGTKVKAIRGIIFS